MQDANLTDFNMVGPLNDGSTIYIASKKDKEAVSTVQEGALQPGTAPSGSPKGFLKENAGTGGRQGKQAPDHKINLNRATVDEISQLPGIGPKMAQDIIAYRQQLGHFKDLTELRKIRGIGDRRLQRIKDFVSL